MSKMRILSNISLNEDRRICNSPYFNLTLFPFQEIYSRWLSCEFKACQYVLLCSEMTTSLHNNKLTFFKTKNIKTSRKMSPPSSVVTAAFKI